MPTAFDTASPEACFAGIADAARELGFEYCVHGLRFPLPITRPRTLYFSNYPPEWTQRYQEQGYLQIDPVVAHGMRSSAPVIWSDALFAATPQLWAEAQAHGLRVGWAQSRRDPEGTYSMLVLARGAPLLTTEELQARGAHMEALVHASHAAMKACCPDPEIDPPPARLSERELEVLRWTAEGKTASEVAQILAISERTVNFHVNCAVAKLEVSNKTAAAVRAAVLGLLW